MNIIIKFKTLVFEHSSSFIYYFKDEYYLTKI